jgi:hypothetical protein
MVCSRQHRHITSRGERSQPRSSRDGVMIIKNEPRRAQPIWKPVAEQYSNPYATILKTTDVSFPSRIEMNPAGREQEAVLMRLLYHTARLLPRYAFPVGLDIVDKYAKVPDWLSRNISARLAASVLNRAMAEGNARLIAQVRQLLAHTPRDSSTGRRRRRRTGRTQ